LMFLSSFVFLVPCNLCDEFVTCIVTPKSTHHVFKK
jgi:hypothetical protein